MANKFVAEGVIEIEIPNENDLEECLMGWPALRTTAKATFRIGRLPLRLRMVHEGKTLVMTLDDIRCQVQGTIVPHDDGQLVKTEATVL